MRLEMKWNKSRVAAAVCLAILALMCLGFSQAALVPQSADDLYESGLLKKEAEGDLNGAIQLFQRVLKTFPQNREVAAKALLQIGICYEKMGLGQAQEAFRKVVEEYPEQTQAVATAREKLSVLASAQNLIEKGGGTFRIRNVWNKAIDSFFSGAPSPDGRYISYVDWENFANLGIHDLMTGENRLLTAIPSWESGEFVYGSVFSPDGKQIAYSWQTKAGLVQLRTVNVDGSSVRILHDGHDASYQTPACWSRDGKQVLTLLYGKDAATKIVFISASDGSVKELKTLTPLSAPTLRMSLSPDGSWIAYSYLARAGSWNSDVFLLSSDGRRQAVLVDHPADDVVLGWSPDGKQVLFKSGRTGSMGLWAIHVSGGQAQGTPELLRGDIGNMRPLGMTRDGNLYYGIYAGWSDIFVASIDPETGKVLVPPTKAVRKYESFNSAPDWSPDGQFLVCRSSCGRMANEVPALLITSVRTNETRELVPKIKGGLNFHYVRWCPDGESVLGIGQDEKGKYGALYSIDIRSGDATIVARSDQDDPIFGPDRTPDGKTIYFWRLGKQVRRVMKFDVGTAAEKELFRVENGGPLYLRVSPDGRHLAVGEGERITIRSPEGTEPHELIQVKGLRGLAWSGDGKDVFYGTAREGSDDICELWRIPVAGGEPQSLDLVMSRMMHLSVHPDGRRIAFTGSDQPGKSEVWVMEGFLAEGK